VAPSSSRWAGDFVAPAEGTYDITVSGSTPYRFVVNGKTFTDTFSPPDPAAPAAADDPGPAVVEMKLKAGQSVPLVIEAHQGVGKMVLQLIWNRGDLDLTQKVADRVKDADVIIYAGGLDGRMEAEEGDIRGLFKDFSAGDRDTIELPACQTALLKALAATGKPVVFVNMTGSAVAMPWEAEHLNAIVQAWYPGEAAGTAVADVLFGAYNPGGRLPVTFYKSTKDLPAFTDYAMRGHTYRYFTGVPQWAFGYGLSYTTFRYDGMKVDKAQAGAGDTVSVSVDLTNTGKRDGDEVVQVYAKPAKPNAGDALQRLVAFKRVTLAAGQTIHVELPVPIQSLRNWDVDKSAYAVPSGTYSISVGASSADARISQDVVVK
jgi:beta-glucosidase